MHECCISNEDVFWNEYIWKGHIVERAFALQVTRGAQMALLIQDEQHAWHSMETTCCEERKDRP